MTQATILPYPTRRDLARAPIPSDERAQRHLRTTAETDRFTTHFGREPRHYTWYYDRLSRWLDDARPDVMIGEVGNFHSHLLALLGRDRGIPFLNPVSSRYPTGRFSFFLGDRLVAVGGSGETMPTDELDELTDEIASGVRTPDYMRLRTRRRDKIAYRGRILKEWAKGERFATQSPLEYSRALTARKRAIHRWESDTTSPSALTAQKIGSRVLYPLQMQPELNLDVWGRQYRDQVDLIRRLSRGVGPRAQLVVKPNPKSFHEMSSALVRETAADPRVVRLPHDSSMRDVVGSCDLVVTVSGTIAIERLLRQEPVVILLDDYARWLGVPTISEIGVSLDSLTADQIERVRQAQSAITPASVLARLVETSYPGVISEPLSAPSVLEPENVERIATAIRHVTPITQALPEVGL